MFVTKLWELGYESYRYDTVIYKDAVRLKKLATSRSETIKTVIQMGKAIAKMIQVNHLRADKFIEERGKEPGSLSILEQKKSESQQERDEREDLRASKSRSSVFIARDFYTQEGLSMMLEQQFYANITDATIQDYFDIALCLSGIKKGGSPQLWRLISREIEIAFKLGQITPEQI